MKNATQIITSLQNKPQFSKLNRFKCIEKIQSMFMPSFTRFVKFTYFQNNTLFFVLNHSAGKQEFDKTVQNIKSALNFYTPDECSQMKVENIKEAEQKSNPGVLDQFVIKLRDFYQKDQ